MSISNFDREDFHAPTVEINTTPLVDIMLVLMVIFLITAPVLEQAIQLDLPKESAASAENKQSVQISITKDAKYYWNSERISEHSLNEKLIELKQKGVDSQIILRADALTPYKDIAHFLALASKEGITNIAFASSER
jgi:biopolymer transport protein ExbD